MAPLVSVIIPTRNRKTVLLRCIASVMDQDMTDHEIIVLDDAGDDGTRESLARKFPGVGYIRSSVRRGPSALRNMGLLRARGEFVLFLDSDVVLPDPETISRQAGLLSRHPEMGQVGGEIPVYLGWKHAARGSRLTFWGQKKQVVSDPDNPAEPESRPCTYLATCNCMVRRKAAFDVGGFDPGLVFGGEDLDFGFRLEKAGLSNHVSHLTGVFHLHEPSGRYSDETRRYHLTRVMFCLKHLDPARNLAIFYQDLAKIALFYAALPPKLALKRIRGEKWVRENFLGGWYMLEAWARGLMNLKMIAKSRKTDFLAGENQG